MSDKLKIDRPIIVEGKYDKIRLQSVVEGEILTTDGFGIFKAEEKQQMLRRIAAKNGVLVLTDSDGGGLVIRNYLNSILPKGQVTHLYIPEIKGREKRKTAASKAGLLGVEGIDCEKLKSLLLPFSSGKTPTEKTRRITKTDLYEAGLCGGEGSAGRRKMLCRAVGIPTNISPNALLEALNLLYTYEEYRALTEKATQRTEEVEK